MTKNIINCLVVLLLFQAITSCKKFVQIAPPPTQLYANSVFADGNTATAAMLNLYSNGTIQKLSFDMSQNCGLLSDELNGTASNDAIVKSYYFNGMSPSNNPGPWGNGAYQQVYQINVILEQLNASSNVSKAIVKQLRGEAAFLRAFWYFELVNCYGAVPMATTSDYKINGKLSRMSTDSVYQQMLSDLRMSLNNLNGNYVDGTDTVMTTERVRPTTWAARSLLSRVFLYLNNYDSAAYYATAVINNPAYDFCSLDSVFLMNSSEAIWQLQSPAPPSRNTFDGDNFILIAAPGNGSANTATISTQLLNSFESGDARKDAWVGVYNGSSDYYFPYKYKKYHSANISEYTMMLRLAEQYLIRAEAEAQLNQLDAAVSDLNAIRARASLALLPGNLSKDEVIEAVMHERRIELFAEWGHRWFDLIRTNRINDTMSVVTPLKGGTWVSTSKLFPVPQSELNTNPSLVQNPGYK